MEFKSPLEWAAEKMIQLLYPYLSKRRKDQIRKVLDECDDWD